MIAGLELPEHHDTLEGVTPPSAIRRLAGHREAWLQLARIVNGGHHGVLIEGERGIGKASMAFAMAHLVLARQTPDEAAPPSLDPASPVWRQVAQEAHPNLLYLTRPPVEKGTGFKTVVSVAEVRRIQRFLGLTSGEEGCRIVLIDPANDMNRNAANALLKYLEEPPKRTLFLLVAHGAGGLLPTIRSRCQLVRLSPLGQGDVATVLDEQAQAAVGDLDRDALITLAGGSPRQALVLALYGGADLDKHLRQLMAAPQFDTQLAHRLAEVAGQRGNDVQNDLLRGMLGDIVRAAAVSSALRGNGRRAAQLSSYEIGLVSRFRTADAFNLDRKQELLVALADTHVLLAGGARP